MTNSVINKLHLGNFKAFADPQPIPIRPLTLIYGPNSSGKSSIIQSLLLVRHVLETGEWDVFRTNIGGDTVDLGGFSQYIYRRDRSLSLQWTVEIDPAILEADFQDLIPFLQDLTLKFLISADSHDSLDSSPIHSPVQIQSFSLWTMREEILGMSVESGKKFRCDRLNSRHPFLRSLIEAILLTTTTAQAIQPEDFQIAANLSSELAPQISTEITHLFPQKLQFSDLSLDANTNLDFDLPIPISPGERKRDLSLALRYWLPRRLNDLFATLHVALTQKLETLTYLGPFRSYPPRQIVFGRHYDPNWHTGGGYAWEILANSDEVRNKVNFWLGNERYMQTPYQLIARSLLPSDEVKNYLKNQIHQVLSEDFDREEISENWVQEMMASSRGKIPDITLLDVRSQTPVSHRDVGIGISQVLPVLIAGFSAENRLITIEQPEIHLHPRLQAELGDVFIQSALGDQQNTFLLETHSEHLLLRIMRRMRETASGNLPTGIPPIHPQDICILYVQPYGDKSIVQELPLNKRGELVKAWPGGFFEEGLEETFAF